MNTQRSIVIAIGCVLVVGGSVYALHTERSYSAVWSDAQAEAYWNEQIHTQGAAAAYDAFAHQVKNETVERQHTLSHYFGGALYERDGLDGLSICDSRFSYGCYHEFLTRAIAEHGIGLVEDLGEFCKSRLGSRYLSCEHGIGHGIYEALSHEDNALERALAVCGRLTAHVSTRNCYGGVFMEHNFTHGEVRVVEDGSLFAPCTTLSDTYALTCAYWQAQWWRQSVARDRSSHEAFRVVGDLCRQFAPGSPARLGCFKGVGHIAVAEANFVPEAIAALCDEASDELSERLACLSIAANLTHFKRGTVIAESVCENVEEPSALLYCSLHAQNATHLFLALDL